MIIYLLLVAAGTVLSALFSILPVVTLSSIPYAGPTINSLLISAVEAWNAALVTVPYLQYPYDLFLYVVLPFELLLLVAKLIMGHRVPTNTIN